MLSDLLMLSQLKKRISFSSIFLSSNSSKSVVDSSGTNNELLSFGTIESVHDASDKNQEKIELVHNIEKSNDLSSFNFINETSNSKTEVSGNNVVGHTDDLVETLNKPKDNI